MKRVSAEYTMRHGSSSRKQCQLELLIQQNVTQCIRPLQIGRDMTISKKSVSAKNLHTKTTATNRRNPTQLVIQTGLL